MINFNTIDAKYNNREPSFGEQSHSDGDFKRGILFDIGFLKKSEEGVLESYNHIAEINKDELSDEERQSLLDEVEENITLQNYVLARKDAMAAGKSEFTKEIAESDLQYDSVTTVTRSENGQEEIFINVPVEKITINALEAEAGNNDIDYKIVPTGSDADSNKLVPNQILMDHFYRKDRTGVKVKQYRLHYFKYGFASMFEGLETKIHKILKNQGKKFDGKFLVKVIKDVKIKKLVNITSRVVHPSNFFMDESVNDFYDARDCIELQSLSKEDVRNIYFGNEDLVDSYAKENIDTIINGLMDTDNIVSHYYNMPENRYIILINDILLFSGANPYPHNQSPYVVSVLNKDDKHGYGRGGMCEALRFQKSWTNGLVNLQLEAAYKSNNPIMLVGEDVEIDYDEAILEYGNFLNTHGDVNQLKPVSMPGPTAQLSNMINDFKTMAIEVTGVDHRQLYLQDDISKFAAGLANDTRNRKISIITEDLDRSYGTLLNLRLKNIHYYFDEVFLADALDDKDLGLKKITGRNITVKDKLINKSEDGNISVTSKPGAYGSFFLTEKDIEGNLGVEVITGSDKNILKEVQKEDFKQLFDQFMMLQKLAGTNPKAQEQLSKVDFGELAKMIFSVNGFDIERISPDTNKSELKKKIEELRMSIIDNLPDSFGGVPPEPVDENGNPIQPQQVPQEQVQPQMI